MRYEDAIQNALRALGVWNKTPRMLAVMLLLSVAQDGVALATSQHRGDVFQCYTV